ncbi:MAG TPA: hypothetical protein VLM89_04970 [Phycisphaerae bacterium]|nr:hypothetical protein [Phycisphaerae bacterium]
MKHLQLGIALIVLVAALHGRSLTYGLMLDDNNHRAELRAGDWSLRSLVDASHLGGPQRRVGMWWQDEADQYFFRPVAFLLMRCEYVLGSWRPAVMHGFSLAWTAACGLLVMVLARSTGLRGFWPILAGGLFVLHPANTLTTQWIACQNEQMVTAFLLLGLLCYAQHAGWRWSEYRLGHPGSRKWLVVSVLCFAAALGCRETGIVFLPLVLLGDFLFRRDGLGKRWGVYAVMVILLAGYFAVRHAMLGPLTIPGPPYAYLPSTPGFARFVVDKFVYYVLGLFALVPIVGFAGMEQLRAQPAAFYGAFAVVAGTWGLLMAWLRPPKVVWLWLALAILPLGPVLPVFASSHHLFMASTGMVLAVVTVVQALWRIVADFAPRARRVARSMLSIAMGIYGLAALGLTLIGGAGLAGFFAISELPAREAVSLSRPFKPGDRLFFVNLPPLAFNCIPAIEESSGVRPLTGYALTFSPEFLGMDEPGYVERVGERQLRVWTAGSGYFGGLMGRSMLQAIGRDRPFATGEQFETPDFHVEVLRGDSSGTRDLLFTFVRPLDDPSYHFLVGSRQFTAYPLRLAADGK